MASQTFTKSGLKMEPEDFQNTMTVVSVNSELMAIQLKAPTSAAAVRRLDALTPTYSDFRSQQLPLQSQTTVDDVHTQTQDLNDQVKALSQRIEQMSASATSNSNELGDAISQRAYIQSRIETLQQSVEDESLKTNSVMASSPVLDPAAAEPGLALRGQASRLIGGAALGCGPVLFLAIVSDRQRRRSDVAEALGAPVAISVDRLTPVPGLWLRSPPQRRFERRRAADRERLAHTTTLGLPAGGRGPVVVACIDNHADGGFAPAVAAARLPARGRPTAAIDLIERNVLDQNLAKPGDAAISRPAVMPPRGVLALATSRDDLLTVGGGHGMGATTTPGADITLVLAELDPAVGADHLKPWTKWVLVVATAARSTAERVWTVADIIRPAGFGIALIGAHTAGALLEMGIGLAVAGASMFMGHARVRRTSALLGVIGVFAATLVAPIITTWLWRGQSVREASQLIGRTRVWWPIAQLQRPRLEQLFGSGLSIKSFNGLPIDSNWLGLCLDQGWFEVAIDAALLLTIILLAITHQCGVRHSIALFLVADCIVASITETGLGDASPYLLELVIAACMLAAPTREAQL